MFARRHPNTEIERPSTLARTFREEENEQMQKLTTKPRLCPSRNRQVKDSLCGGLLLFVYVCNMYVIWDLCRVCVYVCVFVANAASPPHKLYVFSAIRLSISGAAWICRFIARISYEIALHCVHLKNATCFREAWTFSWNSERPIYGNLGSESILVGSHETISVRNFTQNIYFAFCEVQPCTRQVI